MRSPANSLNVDWKEVRKSLMASFLSSIISSCVLMIDSWFWEVLTVVRAPWRPAGLLRAAAVIEESRALRLPRVVANPACCACDCLMFCCIRTSVLASPEKSCRV